MTSQEVLESPVHISPRRACHVNLFVSDLERSLKFYNEICGLEIVLRQPSINAGFLSNGNTNHDIGMIGTTPDALIGENGHQIWPAGRASKPGLYHIGWEMEHEFDLVKANLRADAFKFKINRTVRHLSTRSLYAFDADANVHEFYADVSKDWRRLYAEGKRVSGHWQPGELLPQTDLLYQQNPEIRKVYTAGVNSLRFSHVALSVQNFERMRKYFRNIAGLLEVYCNEVAGVCAFKTPANKYPVALILRASPSNSKEDRGLHHFSLEIDNNYSIDEAHDRLVAAGYQPHRKVELDHKASLFVSDPDGLQVELLQQRANTINFKELEDRGELEFGI
jgi:catechol 2,3-dioxygenase